MTRKTITYKGQTFTIVSSGKRHAIVIPKGVSVKNGIRLYRHGWGHATGSAVRWVQENISAEDSIALRDYLISESLQRTNVHIIRDRENKMIKEG